MLKDFNRAGKSMVSQILLLLATMAWGASFFLNKGAMQEVGILSLLFWRFLIVSVIGLIVFYPKVRSSGAKVRRGGLILGFYLFLILFLQMLGMTTASASRAGFITALYVPLTPLAALYLVGTKASLRQIIIIFIGLIGSFLMTTAHGDLFSAATWGDWVLVLGAVAAAVHIVYVEKCTREFKQNSIDLGLWQFLGCFACVTTLALLGSRSFPTQEWNPLSWSSFAWTSVLFNAIVTTGFAFMVQIYAQKKVGSLKAALIFALEAPFSFIFASFFLSETMVPRELFGATLVFLAGIIPEGWLRKNHGTL